LWLPDKLAPREAPPSAPQAPDPADVPEPVSHNEASRILEEVWSAIELNWAKDDDEPLPLAHPTRESLPDPIELHHDEKPEPSAQRFGDNPEPVATGVGSPWQQEVPPEEGEEK